MGEANDSNEILRQNLFDSGCSEEIIDECMALADEKEFGRLNSIISAQKKKLLSEIHEKQKRIDCIDYLSYRLSKENG